MIYILNKRTIIYIHHKKKMDTKECSRCHCSKPLADFVGRRGGGLKTCVKCRDSSNNGRIIDPVKNREYQRNFRARNPGYDNRDRREYLKNYHRMKKQNKLLQSEV